MDAVALDPMAELLAAPEGRYEWVDGSLVEMSPPPSEEHNDRSLFPGRDPSRLRRAPRPRPGLRRQLRPAPRGQRPHPRRRVLWKGSPGKDRAHPQRGRCRPRRRGRFPPARGRATGARSSTSTRLRASRSTGWLIPAAATPPSTVSKRASTAPSSPTPRAAPHSSAVPGFLRARRLALEAAHPPRRPARLGPPVATPRQGSQGDFARRLWSAFWTPGTRDSARPVLAMTSDPMAPRRTYFS